MSSISVPILSEAHTLHGRDGLKRAWESLTKLSMYLSVPILAFICVHADSIIRVFYTTEVKLVYLWFLYTTEV